MKIEKKELEKGQVELTIEVPFENLKPYIDKACEDLSQEQKISGFRPGKAPYDVLVKHIPEMTILQHASQYAINKTLLEAVTQKKLEVATQPSVEIVKLAAGNPFVYKATLSLVPTVELGDYKTLEIKKRKAAITAKDIEQVLDQLSKMHAKKNPKEGEAQKGDGMNVTFTVSLDNVVVENGKHENFFLELGSGKMIPGFEDQLMGLKKGDEKKFSLKFPDDYHAKNLKGQTCDFDLKVDEVFEVSNPDVKKELPKLLQFEDYEKLENSLRERLSMEKQADTDQKQEKEMIDLVISKSKFSDIPDALIENECNTMIKELETSVMQQGHKFDEYLQSIHKTAQDLMLEFSPQAVQRIKGAIVIAKISELENIQVSEEEIEKEIAKIKIQCNNDEKIMEQVTSPTYKKYLNHVLTSKKTVQKLKDIVIKE